jgi:hypothetical protein
MLSRVERLIHKLCPAACQDVRDHVGITDVKKRLADNNHSGEFGVHAGNLVAFFAGLATEKNFCEKLVGNCFSNVPFCLTLRG